MNRNNTLFLITLTLMPSIMSALPQLSHQQKKVVGILSGLSGTAFTLSWTIHHAPSGIIKKLSGSDNTHHVCRHQSPICLLMLPIALAPCVASYILLTEQPAPEQESLKKLRS